MSGITSSLHTLAISVDLLTAVQEHETEVTDIRGSLKMKPRPGHLTLPRSSLPNTMKLLCLRPLKMRRLRNPKLYSHLLAFSRLWTRLLGVNRFPRLLH